MTVFPSKYSSEELTKRWDEYTSPARFAGNDDNMDLIFVSKRNGSKLNLVRRARASREIFSSIFRGKIVATDNGSEIQGYFTKSIFDYVSVVAIIGILFYIRTLVIERGGNINAINTLLAAGIIGGMLLLINTRRTKRKYAEFIFRITGEELPIFKSKKERDDLQKND